MQDDAVLRQSAYTERHREAAAASSQRYPRAKEAQAARLLTVRRRAFLPRPKARRAHSCQAPGAPPPPPRCSMHNKLYTEQYAKGPAGAWRPLAPAASDGIFILRSVDMNLSEPLHWIQLCYCDSPPYPPVLLLFEFRVLTGHPRPPCLPHRRPSPREPAPCRR